MSNEANISQRRYIFFLPHPLPPGTPVPYTLGLPENNPLNLVPAASEPTRTTVLTSTNNTFVDIRITRPRQPGEVENPNVGGNMDRLDWAFAGTSTSVPITAKSTDPAPAASSAVHSVWTHWLDSRFPVGHTSIPPDEGDMYPVPNYPTSTLEHGSAANPVTGRMECYEEMWEDVPVQAIPTSTLPATGAKKWCVVLRLDDMQHQARGVVIRVGQFVQGLVKQGNRTYVERWEYNHAKEFFDRVSRIGDGFVPCPSTFEPTKLGLGNRMTYGDFEWVVEEMESWD
ncbi:hypothetical protein EJ04DRAFT_442373 [Polyplosphaeria fusca]|uniref:Protein HRI1 n=1 Tax=Polyplosphaeria fusca TaxID=682080 RepID=A0A9P4QQC6_9PLEO|nr:hypothetical protein EJ04DRAFT_442373 [Polyplosphaeria fusca]